jgi:carotenoid cleavage dioxygenase-like enzyme
VSQAVDEKVPFHLSGNFAPVPDEITSTDLEVEGSIPPELRGAYYRNGPNPVSGNSAHWFQGDGMLHGVRLEGGRAAWYRNRWVQTRYLSEGEDNVVFVNEKGEVDRTAAKANTHVVCHAGRLLALVESSLPTEMTRELETVGLHDFDGRLDTAMTAHPKFCPKTGEMHFFGYGFAPPFLTYHVADADGKLVHSEEIPVQGPTMIHDFAVTASHAIFMDLPVVFSPENLGAGMPYAWSDDYGARLGVMPRGGSAADLRWFEVDPCYVFHAVNAYDEGDGIVMDVARYPELWRGDANHFNTAKLHRWRFDLASGKVSEEALDDRGVEFPRIDPRCETLPHRYGWAVGFQEGPDGPSLNTLLRYDLRGGATVEHDFGPARAPGEAVFVPASETSAEDEGWVLSLVYDEGADRSELAILDATRFDAPPVATVKLPRRVPFGFHGSWVPDPA